MLGRDRKQDLTEVFDQTWKANHNSDVKLARGREKQFVNKMFNVNQSESMVRKDNYQTPAERAKNLHDKMNQTIRTSKQIDVKNFMNKYK